jgi:lysophospholipase L1-like esterase
MSRVYTALRSALTLGAVAAVAACTGDTASKQVLGPRLTGNSAIFQSYVSLGNSITAGYQSSGINDSTQRRAYPVLFASQVGTRFIYPSLAMPGCAPPISNFTTQVRVPFGTTATTSSSCFLRNPAVTDLLNNVAVPGATVSDLTAPTGTAASNTLTSLFLGGRSQVQKALQSNPTFASIWIGNNDVLAAAVSGVLVPMAGVSPGVTPVATYTAKFDEAINQLTTAKPNLEGMLFGVVKVTNAPILFPVAVLQTNAAFLAGFDQASGRVSTSTDPYKAAALTIDPNCTGNGGTLVSFLIASQIRAFRNDTNATGQPPKAATSRAGHPPVIACGTNTLGLPATVGEVFILTTAEQTSLNTTVDSYNSYLSTKAGSLGWAYWNPNQLLDSLKTAGQIPVAPNLASGTATFGAWVSLDGVHPSTQTQRAIANHMIDSVNVKYSVTIPKLTIP